MNRTVRMRLSAARVLILLLASASWGERALAAVAEYDVVIVGGTPGGIMSAVAAARLGHTALLLERTSHIGGLPANGLGATDIGTRGATGGLFLQFVGRIRQHYVDTYGADSPQVRACSDGYHFEPSVAERIFEQLLAEQPQITVLKRRQFDALPQNVTLEASRLVRVRVTDRDSGQVEEYVGKRFIDATYEGDLAAAAGAPFTTRREGAAEYKEPLAGRVYKAWASPHDEVAEGTTGEGDDTIQAFNYRLCLTKDPARRVPIGKPERYDRSEYVSIVEDVRLDRWANKGGRRGKEIDVDGIGRVVNIVMLPNGKTDANNQHAAFLSTDLPEENYRWPTADWAWRDQFASRLRDYTMGLLWFCQHDPALPEEFRRHCAEWGLANDEYTDNGNFPRQVYVREGRRVVGEHLFTAHDALPTTPNRRPPVYADSITASQYNLDSHAHHKREPGRVHLDGFISYPTQPYTVPYGVIVPKRVENLLTPVPVSGTHIGFSTLRMEPCWMALGEAAGAAAALSIDADVSPRKLDVGALQDELLKRGAILIYFRDLRPGDPQFALVQRLALRQAISGWQAELGQAIDGDSATRWANAVGLSAAPAFDAAKTTRGEFLKLLAETSQPK